MGKSQHLAQIRSLGLLHDLQEYISSVECLAAEQKRELEKVREEKRDIERNLARVETAAQERAAGAALDFSVSEVVDLPPRLRALVEDNRGLRELVRRYKLRTSSLEQQVAQLHAQVQALADANVRLKQSLAECSRTPAEVDREEVLRRQLEVKMRQVENLEHGMGVLRSKLETDSKLYRQNLTSAAREKDALKRQLVGANRAVEERDKEIRALNVELRRLRRGAPPVRGGPPYQPPVFPAAGDDDDGASGAAAAPAAPAVEPAAHPPLPPPPSSAPPAAELEERIRIMLLIVRDEVRVEVPVPLPQPQPADPPAKPMGGSPRDTSSSGEQPQPQEEESAAAMEPAPQFDMVSEQLPGEPSLILEAVSDSEPPPVAAVLELPLAEEASAMEPAPGMTTDGEYEPSVVGLLEDGTTTLPGEASLGGGLGGLEGPPAVLEVNDGGGGSGADALEPYDALGGGGGMLHSHASAPLPIPYSRTAARALAAKVGGVSVKHMPFHSTGPAGAGGGLTAAAPPAAAAAPGIAPLRKSSTNGGGGGGGGPGSQGGPGAGSVRGGPSLKAVGAASRRQVA